LLWLSESHNEPARPLLVVSQALECYAPESGFDMNLSNVSTLLGNNELMSKWRVASFRTYEAGQSFKASLKLTRLADTTYTMVFRLKGRERMRVYSARLYHGKRLMSWKEVI
jgi:hypothetical protein